jgi:hypothetical protein
MFIQALLQWKSNKYCIIWVCICSFRYPVCNVHAPYYHRWPTQLYNILPHYLKQHDFWKKGIEHKLCVLIFSTTLSETFFILRRIEQDMIKNVYLSSCKLSIIHVIFYWYLNFRDEFLKNIQISHLLKICPVGAELLHTDRWKQTWRSYRSLFAVLSVHLISFINCYLPT